MIQTVTLGSYSEEQTEQRAEDPGGLLYHVLDNHSSMTLKSGGGEFRLDPKKGGGQM